MTIRYMSRFWETGGRLTLPGWYRKGYAFAPTPAPAEPLPSAAELEAWARKPLEVRQHAEQQGYGYVVSLGDSNDRKRERAQRKRAA